MNRRIFFFCSCFISSPRSLWGGYRGAVRPLTTTTTPLTHADGPADFSLVLLRTRCTIYMLFLIPAVVEVVLFLVDKVLNSERPGHFMMEVWNPVGNVGVITAFNFPCAVFGWNTCIGLICGDQIVWKGALTASLVTVALGRIVTDVLAKNGFKSVLTVVTGDGPDIGNAIV